MKKFKDNADKLLYDFGLINELNKYGTPHIVGSYSMDLMAWNDLDIYVSNESMSTGKLYELTSFILNTFKPVWYEAKQDVIDGKTAWFHGFETEILGVLYNVDIWFFDKPTIEKAEKYCDDISKQVNNNEQLKTAIIKIKQELINRKLYSFDKYTSIDVYDAVLYKGIMNINDFIENTGKLHKVTPSDNV